MPPSSTPSSSSPYLPPDLTQSQKSNVERLWATQTRPLVHVKTKDAAKVVIDNHTYQWIVRLHAFIEAFLNHNTSSNDDGARGGEGGDLQSGEPVFVERANNSCLLNLAVLVVQQQQTPPNNGIKLVEGRRTVSIHHVDFLNELSQWEFRGQTPTEEYTARNSFGAYLYHKSDQALAALGVSISLAIATVHCNQRRQQGNNTAGDQSNNSLEGFLDRCQIIVRFHHVQPENRMMDIRTGLAYKFLSIKGHVVKARPKRLRVVMADFCCNKCGAVVTHLFKDGRYSVPTKCGGGNCRNPNMTIQRSTARYLNMQELRIQEVQEESTAHAGRTPRQMEVLVTDDLVDACRPGDIVTVAAVVEAVNSAVAQGKTGRRAQETSTYQLYLRGHSIVTTTSDSRRDGDRSQQKRGDSQATYTQKQLQSITQLAHADHRYFGMMERRAFPFDLLVRSLCPSIIGHHSVKAGILLCLLGGTPPSTPHHQGTTIRSNSHMLIVGDPGMGKSQMLLAAIQVAARSVYVGGNTASTTGLTVSMTKESGGEAGIEAGALVLADQGLCCIDEFDKMAKSHQDGLLEAMEQQQISIAKAGVVASLPARCSILAAANPKHGSYNMSKTVAENLNMATPILSRFDLVFILRDHADSTQDRLVSSNIMNLYRRGSREGTGSTSSSSQSRYDNNGDENRMPLEKRLAWVTGFQKNPLPADLVRDYIAYAREYCKPKLTKEAAMVLKEYFMNLRYPTDEHRMRKEDTVPITTRQLEALIRLSQARAKACLRDYVLEEDALDVVELMSKSVEQVHQDELGRTDRGRGGAGGTSQRKMKKAMANEVFRLVGVGAECTLDDLRRIADKLNCGLNDFPTLIENLRNDGMLMKTARGTFKVTS